MAAGYPSWTALLAEIGEELGIKSSQVHDLAALAQWSIQENGGATRVREVIKREIGEDRALPDALSTIARLPVRTLWTTNYDRLIERAFASISRPLDVVAGAADLALKARPGAARLFKMHGSVERLDDIVISTDDYELYRTKRGSFLPLLQAHLTSMSMLFVGLSLTDPNIRHVLSSIRESFTDAPPEHFALLRPPQPEDFDSKEEFEARSAQHRLWAKDLQRYGLVAVELDGYAEVPSLLHRLERRVAMQRVWVSGSWPVDEIGPEATKAYEVASGIGSAVGLAGSTLVSGAGLLVGSASIAGFLESLRANGGWDLERRLIARPFPQPLKGKPPDEVQWKELRTELARLAGTVVFIGGVKRQDGDLVAASGVREEFELAEKAGAFLLPIGATGGAAAQISAELRASSTPATGLEARRPTDQELDELANPKSSAAELVSIAVRVLQRVQK